MIERPSVAKQCLFDVLKNPLDYFRRLQQSGVFETKPNCENRKKRKKKKKSPTKRNPNRKEQKKKNAYNCVLKSQVCNCKTTLIIIYMKYSECDKHSLHSDVDSNASIKCSAHKIETDITTMMKQKVFFFFSLYLMFFYLFDTI